MVITMMIVTMVIITTNDYDLLVLRFFFDLGFILDCITRVS